MTGRTEHVDLSTVAVTGDGVQWSLEASSDLNGNLVHLEPGHAIDEHVNNEVEVLVVGLAGDGTLRVDGADLPLGPDLVALVPRGARRRIEAGPGGLTYLTVHRRRGPLRIGSPPAG